MTEDWVVWQLADSAFPAGAFAHSSGLEAAWQLGEVGGADGLEAWVAAMVGQSACSALPAVAAAWEGAMPLAEVDAFFDATLLNHVANRASRAQGQALLMACARTFEGEGVRALAAVVRGEGMAGHFATVFGAVARALGIRRGRACELFLFLWLRGAVSSAVRLGIVGPLQGQALQHRLGAVAAEWAGRGAAMPLQEAAQTSFVADLLQGTQDRLYSRLFVS